MARKVSKDKKLRTSPPTPAKPPSKKDVKPSGKEKSAKPAKPTVVAAKIAPPKNGKPVVAEKSVSKTPKDAATKDAPFKVAAAKDISSKGSGSKDTGSKDTGSKGSVKKPAAKGVAEPAKGAKSKDGAPAKLKEAAPKRKRKSSVVRLKAYWGVFNQMLKRVAVYEYAERKAADKRAAELGSNAKQPHFVQLVKEVIREEE